MRIVNRRGERKKETERKKEEKGEKKKEVVMIVNPRFLDQLSSDR